MFFCEDGYSPPHAPNRSFELKNLKTTLFRIKECVVSHTCHLMCHLGFVVIFRNDFLRTRPSVPGRLGLPTSSLFARNAHPDDMAVATATGGNAAHGRTTSGAQVCVRHPGRQGKQHWRAAPPVPKRSARSRGRRGEGATGRFSPSLGRMRTAGSTRARHTSSRVSPCHPSPPPGGQSCRKTRGSVAGVMGAE